MRYAAPILIQLDKGAVYFRSPFLSFLEIGGLLFRSCCALLVSGFQQVL